MNRRLLRIGLCAGLWGCSGLDPAPIETGSPPESGIESGLVDEDQDGFGVDVDCDDTNPAVHPEADEICDGIDQDCDGEVDDGIPTDGDGCQDPGPPIFDGPVDWAQVAIRTSLENGDGTNNKVQFCLSDSLCFDSEKPNWDDYEEGFVDVSSVQLGGVSRDTLTGLTLQTVGGSDMWRPTCAEVTLNGELVYCRDGLTQKIGQRKSDEVASWTDEDGWTVSCETCFERILTHGPMVGEVGHDRAQLWWRTNSTVKTAVKVATSKAQLGLVDYVHYAYPRAEDDFTTQVEIVGLSPDTVYYYQIDVGGKRFGPWTFKTAAKRGDGSVFKFAFGSNIKDVEQPIFKQVTSFEPNVFLFLGDNQYARNKDLDTQRQYYRWALERADRAEMIAQTSTLAVWNDLDYLGAGATGQSTGKEFALKAFDEYWANESLGVKYVPGIFSVASYGDVDFFLLDDRYYRATERTILGSSQDAWLEDALRASDATFRILVTGGQWTTESTNNSWALYPASRDRIFSFIRDEKIGGVVLLSGDMLRTEFRLLAGAEGGYPIPELSSSPLAANSASCRTSAADELKLCEAGSDYFIGVTVDTTGTEATLTAVVYDVESSELGRWEILRSELE